MTEAEWLACSEPQPMLQFLSAKKNKRKLALFGVACCRHISRLCNDELAIIAIEVAESYADRKAKINEVRAATRNAREDLFGIARPLGHYAAEIAVLANAAFNERLVSEYALEAASDQAAEKAHQCALLHEIFGSPFHRVRIRKGFITPTVSQLAQGIYNERAFDRMPILGDALEDAGCDNASILEHCRSGGEHVRGCWVVDLLMGKE
jgi:hypothetical protein